MTTDSAQLGGIAHIEAGRVHAVTDPHGPVNMGAGTQFYIHAATFAAAEVTPTRSPRLIVEEMLLATSRRFVAPPQFDQLRQRLHSPATVLLAGANGSGRHTAALMLLHSCGGGDHPFRELSSDPDELSTALPDLRDAEPGERILFDLSRGPDALLSRLADYYYAAARNNVYFVVILPEQFDHALPMGLRHLVGRIQRPDGRTVLHRHLTAVGIAEPVADLDIPELAAHLTSDPMRELARLAGLIEETRAAAGATGTLGDWAEKAVSALSAPLDEVAKQFQQHPDGHSRALLLAAAMFEHAPAEVVFHATDALLTTLAFAPDPTHHLEQPGLAECLNRLDVDTTAGQRVRFRTVNYGGAVLSHFWLNFPALRPQLCQWLNTALRTDQVSDHLRATVLRRFSTHCLRSGHPEDLFWLVERWTQDGPGQTRALAASASRVLADGLVDERHGSVFRQQVYRWSTTRSLPRTLSLELVRLCAEAIAPTLPDRALVRLRHLTRNVDTSVSDAARATLVTMCREDDRALRQVLHQLAEDQSRLWEIDFELFAALADPGPLSTTAGRRQRLLSQPDIRIPLTSGWRNVMANRPHEQWAPLAQQWLRNHQPGNDTLAVLVEAAGGRSDLQARLYVVARDCAQLDPQHRHTAAELLRRSDQANGLDLTDTRPTPATQGVTR